MHRPHVPSPTALLHETATTLHTREPPIVFMDPHVLRQNGFPREPFQTNVALEVLPARMLQHVVFQLLSLEEAHVALRTLVIPLQQVVFLRVYSQRVLVRERFVARQTLAYHRRHTVHGDHVLVLHRAAFEPLVADAAFVRHVLEFVDCVNMRPPSLVCREDFVALAAFERTRLVRVLVGKQRSSVDKPAVAYVTHVIPVMRVHVLQQHFVFAVDKRTHCALEIFSTAKFEWNDLILNVGIYKLLVFALQMFKQSFYSVDARVTYFTFQLRDIELEYVTARCLFFHERLSVVWVRVSRQRMRF